MTKQQKTPQHPWEALDPGLAPLLASRLGGLEEEIATAIGAEIPEYRKPMSGAFGRAVRVAIEEALRQFTAMIGHPAGGDRPGRQVYIDLGRGESRQGRSLDALQAAYRLGARLAWRRIGEVALDAGIAPEQMSLLAESIFAYIDELSAESVEGYAQEQAAAAGALQGRREQLMRLLLTSGESAEDLAAAASAAGWRLPRTVAAIACEYYDPRRLAQRTGVDVLGAEVPGGWCLLVPDPDAPQRRELLADALARLPAALGPSVAVERAAESHERAFACLTLILEGVLPSPGLVAADEQLAALVVFGGRGPLTELAERRLEPLAALTPAQRARFEQTLWQWLRLQGSVPAIAAELHVHAQTVRYRLTRLRELFGDALDDPDARFELELALRARRWSPAQGSA